MRVMAAANVAAIAMPLRGSKRAFIGWMIAVEGHEKEWGRGWLLELEGAGQDAIAAPAMLVFLVHDFLTPARSRPAAWTNGGIAEHLRWTQRYYWGEVTPM